MSFPANFDDRESVRNFLTRFAPIKSADSPVLYVNIRLQFENREPYATDTFIDLQMLGKIAAIKIVRDAFGSGLLEAKRLVDAVCDCRMTLSGALPDGSTVMTIEPNYS